MDERSFWNIVRVAREEAGAWDVYLMGTAIAEYLKDEPEREILDFDRILDSLMDRAYQAALWDAADIIVCGCSDDGFMDFRAWLIAQGQRVYEAALENPDSLSTVIPSKMRYATLNGLLTSIAWDAHYIKTQQPIPERGYKMPKLNGQRMEWEARKSSFPRLRSALGDCNPLVRNVVQTNPSATYGIYEFADETDGGRFYIGGSISLSLATRFEQHRLKGRILDLDKKVIWSHIAKPEFIDIAERVRLEQIASFPEYRSKLANICRSVAYHPASDERVRRFYEQKIWKQIEGWPNWLFPPDEYADRIGLGPQYREPS